jgi:mycofactocin system transcriptional regulator
VASDGSRQAQRGRPPATSRTELERVALDLFARDGFEETTVEHIADAAGVGRRTFFRYYASKNDVVWGEFDVMLQQMEAYLDKVDEGPVIDGLAEAVIRFNAVPPPAVAAHRQRMALILHVPALQAHSTLRYTEWRDVVARYVARRTGTSADAFHAQLVGQLALGAAAAAYEEWLRDERTDLADLLASAFRTLASGVDG